MKIQALHFAQVGPLRQVDINLVNDWSGVVESNILFSGPNGCGKSTVLRSVAALWQVAGFWLDKGAISPAILDLFLWMKKWQGMVVIFDECNLPGFEAATIGLMFGKTDWCASIQKRYPKIEWLGEAWHEQGGHTRFPQPSWYEVFLQERKKMLLSFDASALANIIFLDAEERRWVAPKSGIGTLTPDSPAMRWSPRYQAREEWHGQLEAMLINLKTTQPRRFTAVLRELNAFLLGKEIESTIPRGENRLRVKLHGQRGQWHNLDELSAGEHQILIILFLIARWAEKGCIVMIDEPDLYLHPSLVGNMLARLEAMVQDLGGQLLITSHLPMVWQHFENKGRRIELGAGRE